MPPMSPKITLEKEKKKWKQRGERKKEKKKKIMAALVLFMLSSLKTEFERKNLFDGRDLFWL